MNNFENQLNRDVSFLTENESYNWSGVSSIQVLGGDPLVFKENGFDQWMDTIEENLVPV